MEYRAIMKDGSEQTISHWGIKGQKWGERRYQNEDGSLTPEGRIHYGYEEERSRQKLQEYTNKEQRREIAFEKKMQAYDAKSEYKLSEKAQNQKTKRIVKAILAGATAIGISAFAISKIRGKKGSFISINKNSGNKVSIGNRTVRNNVNVGKKAALLITR